jgi:hypothetical protein
VEGEVGRKRYTRLVEAEKRGQLKVGGSTNCPQCGTPNCCYRHNWVYHKWWENIRPSIERLRSLRIKRIK